MKRGHKDSQAMAKSSISTRANNGKKKSGSIPDLRKIASRKDITAVTMNMSGRSGLGLTPRFKIDMVKNYLGTMPDVVIVQDSIDLSDMSGVLDAAGNGMYQWYFRPDHTNSTHKEREMVDDDENGDNCVTGIVWNKEKYIGTPLQMDDERLGEFTKWLKKHNIVIVKLDSCQRTSGGAEDVYPSFVAISWHGPDYEIALRQRNQICEEFFAFLSLLRKNNWFVPILIGGDFNIDLKSFNFEKHQDFLYVPYRPISGNLAKDLKNTFLFTVDSLQVTETSFKQFHPDIYPTPFISIRLRGRTKIKIWAVVKIQRSFRAYLRRIREKKAGMKKLKESKKRWRKKIEGDNYISEPDTDDEIAPPPPPQPKAPITPMKISKIEELSLNGEIERKVSGNIYSGEPLSVPVVNHRRKRYSDLKSIYEKKEEMRGNEALMRSFKKAEKFEF